jgi:putative DNA primase/helicase
MTASEIARALGGARRSGRWWRTRCPVHASRGLTLALRDHLRGLVVHCHAGCSREVILAQLRRLRLFADGVEYRPASVSLHDDSGDDTARRVAAARRLWQGGQDARGSPVERYLRSRGIETPSPLSLRWTPACRHPNGRTLPAVLARIDAEDVELIGVHRIFLRPDGSGKAAVEPVKAMLGRAAGGAVRLAPAAETLMVAEGVETCLAAMQATASSGWAALSTSGLVGLVLPPIVREVVILADNDASGAGQRAAYTAAARWLAEGRRVRMAMPPVARTDFNDVLLGRAYAAIGDDGDVAA